MNKSDLKDGMVVVHRNGEEYILIQEGLFKNDFTSDSRMFDYNNDLTHKKNKYNDIMQIFSIGKMIELWEREEVDWSKVPFGTKVRCWNNVDNKFEGKFLGYDEGANTYIVFVSTDRVTDWECCELIEDPKEELTYNEMMKSIDRICDGIYEKNKTCNVCSAFCNGCGCDIGIIADDNFTITRK